MAASPDESGAGQNAGERSRAVPHCQPAFIRSAMAQLTRVLIAARCLPHASLCRGFDDENAVAMVCNNRVCSNAVGRRVGRDLRGAVSGLGTAARRALGSGPTGALSEL